jgi:hypothetical protein
MRACVSACAGCAGRRGGKVKHRRGGKVAAARDCADRTKTSEESEDREDVVRRLSSLQVRRLSSEDVVRRLSCLRVRRLWSEQ